MPSPPLVEFQNVTVYRGDRVALDGLNLSIPMGEHVAILGPNGSGKSTFVKTITRECYPVLQPDSSVRILGERVWNVFDLRVLLGIVSDDLLAHCQWEISVRELVLSGFFSSVGVWPYHEVTPEMERKAGEIIGRLEIAALAGRSIHQLSSGELRRALVGRALVHAPKALLLAEPANSLDVRARHELYNVLGRLAAAGTAIVMVTHHLEDVLPEIERVVLLRRGRVFRDGPKARVLTSEALSEAFEPPLRVVRHRGRYRFEPAGGA
jgi:iron complex transport system ATP-binding protein